MLDSLLPPAESANFLGSETTEAIFISALTWSLGGGLLENGRTVFDGFVKRIASLPQNPAEGSVVGPGMISFVLLIRRLCCFACDVIAGTPTCHMMQRCINSD